MVYGEEGRPVYDPSYDPSSRIPPPPPRFSRPPVGDLYSHPGSLKWAFREEEPVVLPKEEEKRVATKCKSKVKAKFKARTWVRVAYAGDSVSDGNILLPDGAIIRLGESSRDEDDEDSDLETPTFSYEIEGSGAVSEDGELCKIKEADIEALTADDLINIHASVHGADKLELADGSNATEAATVEVASRAPKPLATGDGTTKEVVQGRIKAIDEEAANLKDILVWMEEAKSDVLDDLEYRIFTAIRKLDASPSKVQASKVIAKLLGNEIRAAGKRRK